MNFHAGRVLGCSKGPTEVATAQPPTAEVYPRCADQMPARVSAYMLQVHAEEFEQSAEKSCRRWPVPVRTHSSD